MATLRISGARERSLRFQAECATAGESAWSNTSGLVCSPHNRRKQIDRIRLIANRGELSEMTITNASHRDRASERERDKGDCAGRQNCWRWNYTHPQGGALWHVARPSAEDVNAFQNFVIAIYAAF